MLAFALPCKLHFYTGGTKSYLAFVELVPPSIFLYEFAFLMGKVFKYGNFLKPLTISDNILFIFIKRMLDYNCSFFIV